MPSGPTHRVGGMPYVKALSLLKVPTRYADVISAIAYR